MSINKNFFCISSFNDNLDWFQELDYPHIIYDKCSKGINKSKYSSCIIEPSNLSKRYPNFNIIDGDIEGYNLNEYLSFIISNYEKLPENVIFIKGNIIKRHISKEFLFNAIDNKYFTSLEDWKLDKTSKDNFFNRNSFILSDGGWVEKNNNWYLNKKRHPTKYFNNFNVFMNFIFKKYINPKYIRFCPGANYIVPKTNILKFNKQFYINLKFIIGHNQLSGESHILERALFSIWNSEYEVSAIMKKKFDTNSVFPKKDKQTTIFFKKVYQKFL